MINKVLFEEIKDTQNTQNIVKSQRERLFQLKYFSNNIFKKYYG